MNLLSALLAESALEHLSFSGSTVPLLKYSIPSTGPKAFFSNSAFTAKMAALVSSNATSYTRLKSIVDSRSAVAGATLLCGWYDGFMYQLTKNETYATYAYNSVMNFIASEEAIIAAGSVKLAAGNQLVVGVDDTRAEFGWYLYVGDVFSELLLNYDWCRHKFTQSDKDRLFAYVNQSLYNMVNFTQAFFNNDTPSNRLNYPGWALNTPTNNYFYSQTLAFASLSLCTAGENPKAQYWLDYFMNNQVPLINSELDLLEHEGGCLEGTNYAMSLNHYLFTFHMLSVSMGFNLADQVTFSKDCAYWLFHNWSPDGTYLTASGDQSRDSEEFFMDYGRQIFLQILALYPGDPCCRAAKQKLLSTGYTQMTYAHQYYADMFYPDAAVAPLPQTAIATHYANKGVGYYSFRANWTTTSTWIAQQVGLVYESHQHFTNGTFEIYKKGWLFDTSSRRSNGLLAFPGSANCARFDINSTPDINYAPTSSITQTHTTRTGRNYPDHASYLYAYYNDSNVWYTESNTQPAYADTPEVVKCRRGLLVLKNPTTDNFVTIVFDELGSATAATVKVYQMNTPLAATVAGRKFTMTSPAGVNVAVYAADANVSTNWVNIAYPIINGFYFRTGTRIERRVSGVTNTNFLHVVDVELEVTSVTANNTGTTSGANIVFNDGRTAQIVFNNTSLGGTLIYTSALGKILYSGALPSTVNNYSRLA